MGHDLYFTIMGHLKPTHICVKHIRINVKMWYTHMDPKLCPIFFWSKQILNLSFITIKDYGRTTRVKLRSVSQILSYTSFNLAVYFVIESDY